MHHNSPRRAEEEADVVKEARSLEIQEELPEGVLSTYRIVSSLSSTNESR